MYAAYTPYTPYSVLYHSLILTPARVYPLTLGSAPLPWNKGEPWCIVSGKSWRPFSFFLFFSNFFSFRFYRFPFQPTRHSSQQLNTLCMEYTEVTIYFLGLVYSFSFLFLFLISSLLEVVGLTKYMESYSSNFFTFDSDPGVHYGVPVYTCTFLPARLNT